MKKPRPFMIGADPEFAVCDSSGEIVPACDVISPRHHFGLDGCDEIAELRPSPSFNPSEVVSNIHKDLVAGYNSNPDARHLEWVAGSHVEGYCIGGHIHLGLRASMKNTGLTPNNTYDGLALYLDTYLAQVVRLIENTTQARKRRSEEYGFLGDFRPNSHGMEYRTLGSWLTSPRVAEGVLCLSQTITYEYLSKRLNRETPKLGMLSPAPEVDTEGNFLDVLPGFTREVASYRRKFPTLQKHIRGFKLYSLNKEPIEFIFKLVESKRTWCLKEDMKAAWGITRDTIPEATPQKILPPVRFEDIWRRAKL